jgi:hypothetical protein
MSGLLFKSVDRGQTFSAITTFQNLELNGYSANTSNSTKGSGPYAAIDPNNTNIVYCGSTARGLQRSTDGGATWSVITTFAGGLNGRPYNTATTPTLGTDSTSVTVGTGSKTFSNNSAAFGIAASPTSYLKVWSAADKTNQMIGPITAASGTTFTINVDTAFGSGAHTDWVVGSLISGEQTACGGHRIAFDTSGGTVSAFGKTVTKNVFVHTHDVATWSSTDGGVTWTKIVAANTPSVILRWAVDPYGVLWVVDGDYGASPNARKLDTGVWSVLAMGSTPVPPAFYFASVAVDVANSPSKGATKVAFGFGDQLWFSTTTNGGSTWWNSGNSSNRVFDSVPSGDVDWLVDYYATYPTVFFGLSDFAFDPLISGRAYLASEGIWYTNLPTASTPTLALHEQSRGIEEFVVGQVICPKSGEVTVAAWDFPYFRTANFSAYPTVIGGPFGHTQAALSGYLLSGYPFDFNSNVVAYSVGTSNGAADDTVNKVAYSTDYGVTVNLFPTQPYVGLASGISIACSSGGLVFVVVAPGNLDKPKITTDGGNTWANIALPGGFPVGAYYGIQAFYLLQAKLIESDKTTGDIYLYCVNDGANNDPMYRWNKSSGLWTIQNANLVGSGYQLEQIKSVPGRAGHLLMSGGVDTSNAYITTNGWAAKVLITGFNYVQTFGISPVMPGGTYSTIMCYGRNGGTVGYWVCKNLNPATGVGTWTQVVPGPPSLGVPRDIAGDIVLAGQFYIWTNNGLFRYVV